MDTRVPASRPGGEPTPGPWRHKAVIGVPDEDWWAIMAMDDQVEVAILPRIHEGSEANARLIAAAPELLSALRLIAAMGGKTLMAYMNDRESSAIYSEGAHNAFNQAAEIAADALAKVQP